MATLSLPTSDETEITVAFAGSEDTTTIGIVDLDILLNQVKMATKDTPEKFYELMISEIKDKYKLTLSSEQVWLLLEKKSSMFEALKKSYLP